MTGRLDGCKRTPLHLAEGYRVLIADPNPIWRIGLRIVLERETDISIVADTGDRVEFLHLIRWYQPLVAMVAPCLLGPAAAQFLAQLNERGKPLNPLIVVAEDWEAPSMLQHQIGGYIRKDMMPSQVVNATRSIAEGRPVSVALSETSGENVSITTLSARENEVLSHIAAGRSNLQIADRLHISEHTVKNHVRHIRQKLAINTQRELVAYAWKSRCMMS